jgi:predicted ester cyclase
MMQAAFPDMSWTIGRQVAEGDLVATHTWLEGTHLGPFVGIP